MSTAWDLAVKLWQFEPSVLAGCLLLLLGYLWITRAEPHSKAVLFFAGDAALAIALVSPLDPLGDEYLFSAHMLQHLVIMLVAAPLLVAGLPAPSLRRAAQHPILSRAMTILGNPVLDWFVFAAVLWGWHLPLFYNAALASENVHILEHLMMLAAAVMFFWPILNPLPERRLKPLMIVPYAFSAAVSNSILGVLLTYATPGLYPAYLHPVDAFGILPLIRQGWGLSAEIDQQIGGLAMWVPGSLVFLAMVLVGINRWYASDREAEEPATSAAVSGGFA
jgi:cytochrome c oxidase assembly factor CtaG